ncbi:MAG: FAD-dependent oxidoreductase [Candidatus Limnocylindrales bacterium]
MPACPAPTRRTRGLARDRRSPPRLGCRRHRARGDRFGGGVLVEPDARRSRPWSRPVRIRSPERRVGRPRRVVGFLEGHLPGALGPPIYTKTCLYTLTPERDFVVDHLPDQPGIIVALGAGHGFKFASVLGRITAELATDGTTRSAPDLEAFRIDRPILLEADPATSWMV